MLYCLESGTSVTLAPGWGAGWKPGDGRVHWSPYESKYREMVAMADAYKAGQIDGSNYAAYASGFGKSYGGGISGLRDAGETLGMSFVSREWKLKPFSQIRPIKQLALATTSNDIGNYLELTQGSGSLTTIQNEIFQGKILGGLLVEFGFKDSGSGLTKFNFVQTISTNKLLKATSSPYIDPPGSDHSPFYWSERELADYTNKKGYDVLFEDTPVRAMSGSIYWRAELSVVGMDNSGVYHPIVTITYGFEVNNKVVTSYPVEFVAPSQFHLNAILNK